MSSIKRKRSFQPLSSLLFSSKNDHGHESPPPITIIPPPKMSSSPFPPPKRLTGKAASLKHAERMRAERKLARVSCQLCTTRNIECWVSSLSRRCAFCVEQSRSTLECGVDYNIFTKAEEMEPPSPKRSKRQEENPEMIEGEHILQPSVEGSVSMPSPFLAASGRISPTRAADLFNRLLKVTDPNPLQATLDANPNPTPNATGPSPGEPPKVESQDGEDIFEELRVISIVKKRGLDKFSTMEEDFLTAITELDRLGEESRTMMKKLYDGIHERGELEKVLKEFEESEERNAREVTKARINLVKRYPFTKSCFKH